MYDKPPIDIDRGANIIIIRCFGKNSIRRLKTRMGFV